MAMLGCQSAVSKLRDALGTGSDSWDNPYGNFVTNPPSFYWSVSPGMLTRWSYASPTALTNIALFSYTTPANTNLINLNRPLADGSHPIIGGENPPDVSVQLVNVLQNPALAASSSNPIIGRYAFWIDDESAKININVADGTQKYTTNSLGLGSPTEISLQVLPQAGNPISASEATNIVYFARSQSLTRTPAPTNQMEMTSTSFNSPREIIRVSGTTPDLYTNNVFSLTDYSRSPDINIFGQPKMALMPILGDPHQGDPNYHLGENMVINGISLQPENEIYPTQNQLSKVPIKWPLIAGAGPQAHPWPEAFRAEGQIYNTGRYGDLLSDTFLCGFNPNYCWDNGQLIARYMSGTNANMQPIQWPVFSSTTSPNGFLGKYSFHQIDEVAVQIISLGSRLISSDYPYPLSSDYTNCVATYSSLDGWDQGNFGFRYQTSPLLMDGWLSGQWVIGMSRTQKVTRLGLQIKTTGSITATNSAFVPPVQYQPPQITMLFFLEEWIPGSYRGGNSTPYNLAGAGNWELGAGSDAAHTLNAADVDGNGLAESWLSRSPGSTGDPQTNNTWANQMLTNDQGADFQANPYTGEDPDQYLAAKYHDPWAWELSTTGGYSYPGTYAPDINTIGNYQGGQLVPYGNGTETVFRMAALINNTDAVEWQPGTLRCASGQYGESAPLRISTGADGGRLNIGGGVSVIDSLTPNANSFSDPVPLEAIRGSTNLAPSPYNVIGSLANDAFIDAVPDPSNPIGGLSTWGSTNAMTGYTQPNPVTGLVTTRERNLASVIPINISVPIPASAAQTALNGDPPSLSTNLFFSTDDPLVNKYPGDWHLDTNSFPSDWPASADSVSSYSEDTFLQSMKNSGGDPDSFWIPQADVGFSARDKIASQTLIPRSARMPNIGYLQYIRTGIIPDDETTNYQYFPGNTNVTLQHGTPFRLLSYAPVNDSAYATNQETGRSTAPYPDWALLDLFYMPSIINAYGGPYADFTNLAPFGTYGGATSGRINPNGSVIYTTNVNVPQPDVSRLLPLQATLYGLHVNQTYDSGTAADQSQWAYKDVAGTTVMDAATSQALASNISYFISTNGPLKMPGEICDVPQVAALLAPVNHTRNDLVRQMVGELTTQSNVFSVWAVGQVIQKIPGNNQYGIFESGDQVLGEVRLHLIVERYLDPGADGVYGNTSNPGPDAVTNSMDDPVDPIYHPYQPKYLYRVVRSEEVR